MYIFQDAVSALKNFREHHLVINLISQVLTETAGNQDLTVTTEQLQTKYGKPKHQVMPRNFGARYSVLFQLPYYDAIRFALIDPMHNLLLGTAKHVLKTWIEKGILSESDLQRLQKRVNLVKPPSEIGRIPSKISDGFKGFTADQ